VQAALAEAGVPSAVHYPVPMHRQPAYAALGRYSEMPLADESAEKVLSLPMDAYIEEPQQAYIADRLRHAVTNAGVSQ